MSSKKTRGFTLIELLVVIAIIGILSSVVLASLNSARKKGRDARRISDVKQLQLALELYYDTGSSYPVQALGVFSAATIALLTPTYIPQIPIDPNNGAPYVYQYQSLDSAGAACGTAPCAGYLLVAQLENAANQSSYVGTTPTAGTCTDSPVGAPIPYCAKQ